MTDEFSVDAAGRLAEGSNPPHGLVQLAQAFLLTRRDSVRFVHWYGGEDRLVSITRDTSRAPQRPLAVCSFGKAGIPAGVTSREIDILTLVSLGLTNREIGERLGTSPRTVSTQIENLLIKLGAPTRTALAAMTVDAGLTRLPMPGGVDGVPPFTTAAMQRFAESLDRPPDIGLLSVDSPGRRPLTIGTLAPLDQRTGDDGMELIRGVTMAIDEVNARGGIHARLVEQVIESMDMFDEASAMDAAQRLVDAHVDAVVTNYVTSEQPSVLEILADYGRPFLHTATFERQVRLTNENPDRYSHAFQTCPSEQFYGRAFIDLLSSLQADGGWRTTSRRLGVVQLESDSTQVVNSEFRSDLAGIGWEISAATTIGVDESNWPQICAQLCQAGVGAVLMVDFIPEHAASLVIELRQVGFNGLFHCIYGASVPRFLTLAGEAAEGVTWSSVTTRNSDELGESFSRAYTVRYGEAPGLSQASAAYDQAQLLIRGWETVGPDPVQVVEHLRSSAFRGLNGIYYFGPIGHAVQCYPYEIDDPLLGQRLVTYQVQNGESVRIAPASYVI